LKRLSNSSWYRALTITERLALRLLGVGVVRERSQSFDNDDLAVAKLKNWKSQTPFDTESLFAQRLAMDGVTEADVLSLLSESSRECHESMPAPDWIGKLDEAYTESANSSADVDRGHDGDVGTIMLSSLKPLISKGREDLLAGIDNLLALYSGPNIDKESLAASLVDQLCRQLLYKFRQTYVLELEAAATIGHLAGLTPGARFHCFAERLRRDENILALFNEYSVLAREMVLTVDQWLDSSLELLQRLCADWPQVCVLTPSGIAGAVLESMRVDAGDRHCNGRSVVVLNFEDGGHVVYKPRPLAVDAHFQELLRRLNGFGAQPEFRTLSVLDKGAYGWVEFIQFCECTTLEQVHRFYQRQGANLALLHTLEAIDIHAGNIIASGEHPVLIDLETLFHPRESAFNPTFNEADPAAGALWRSVLRVGLLPVRLWGNADAMGVDISGLGGAGGQVAPRPSPAWVNPGTDEMRLVRHRAELPGHSNQPALADKKVDYLDYADHVVAGFRKMYQLLAAHRAELLDDILPSFAQDTVRFVARPTDIYRRFIYDSLRPEWMRDALERERYLDRLWIGIEWQPQMSRLIGAERADILIGDIPFFTMQAASRDVKTTRGEIVVDFTKKSALEETYDRVRQLSEADRAFQESVIYASFACMEKDTSHGAFRDELRPTEYRQRSDRNSDGELLRAACDIGDELEKTAVCNGGRAGWLTFGQRSQYEWGLEPAGLDFYNGLPGIAFFLAYLGFVTGEIRYQALARAALSNVLSLLKDTNPSSYDLGAFSGAGGIIYLFAHLGSLWHQESLFDDAEKIIKHLPQRIECDDRLDFMSGCAGCILGLLSVHSVTQSTGSLRAAINCGDRLIACARRMPTRGFGWKIPGEDFALAGFAHGAAGIAFALLRLASSSGERRFREAALDAISYEQSLFVDSSQNWPDLRRVRRSSPGAGRAQHFMSAWCNGASGIGLARMSTIADVDNSAIRSEIHAALAATQVQNFDGDYGVCHGTAGYVETLLTFSKDIDSRAYQVTLAQAKDALIRSVRAQLSTRIEDRPNKIASPGFMIGLSGVGHTVLRLMKSQLVPSALVLEPPNRCR